MYTYYKLSNHLGMELGNACLPKIGDHGVLGANEGTYVVGQQIVDFITRSLVTQEVINTIRLYVTQVIRLLTNFYRSHELCSSVWRELSVPCMMHDRQIGFCAGTAISKVGWRWGCHRLVASVAVTAFGKSRHLLQWRCATKAYCQGRP